MSNLRKIEGLIKFYTKGVTPKYVNKSSIIVLNQKCIRNNKIDFSFAQYTDDKRNYPENKFLKIGDVLINSTGQGTAGRVALVDFIPDNYKVIIDSHILLLRFENYHEAKCLNYSLFSVEKMLQTFIDGSTGQGEFDKVRLFNLSINFTKDKAEQKKVASILSLLDSKIEINNRINAELEAMAKTLYDYWFVQFDFPDKNGKPYKSSGGKMVYNTVLKRDIPEGWDVKKLSEILYTVNDSIEANEYLDLNYLPIDKLPSKKIYYQEYSERKNANSSLIKFCEDDILLGAMRVYFHRVCNAIEDGISRSTIMVIRAINLNHKNYGLFTLSKDEAIDFANKNSTGTSIPYAKWENGLSNYKVVMPCEDLINQFNDFTNPILSKFKILCKQNQQLSQSRNWLLPILMNGQVTVDNETRLDKDEVLAMVAEPTPIYDREVIELVPDKMTTAQKAILAGHIINLNLSEDFGRVKLQKLLFLVEYDCKIDLDSNYVQRTAGPHDQHLLDEVEGQLIRYNFFNIHQEKANNKRVHYKPLSASEELETLFVEHFPIVSKKVNDLLAKLKESTWEQCEIIATLFAVWNNRLIKNESTDPESLKSDFLKWDSKKKKYKDRLDEELVWMRNNNIVPDGWGKLIEKPIKKF